MIQMKQTVVWVERTAEMISCGGGSDLQNS